MRLPPCGFPLPPAVRAGATSVNHHHSYAPSIPPSLSDPALTLASLTTPIPTPEPRSDPASPRLHLVSCSLEVPEEEFQELLLLAKAGIAWRQISNSRVAAATDVLASGPITDSWLVLERFEGLGVRAQRLNVTKAASSALAAAGGLELIAIGTGNSSDSSAARDGRAVGSPPPEGPNSKVGGAADATAAAPTDPSSRPPSSSSSSSSRTAIGVGVGVAVGGAVVLALAGFVILQIMRRRRENRLPTAYHLPEVTGGTLPAPPSLPPTMGPKTSHPDSVSLSVVDGAPTPATDSSRPSLAVGPKGMIGGNFGSAAGGSGLPSSLSGMGHFNSSSVGWQSEQAGGSMHQGMGGNPGMAEAYSGLSAGGGSVPGIMGSPALAASLGQVSSSTGGLPAAGSAGAAAGLQPLNASASTSLMSQISSFAARVMVSQPPRSSPPVQLPGLGTGSSSGRGSKGPHSGCSSTMAGLPGLPEVASDGGGAASPVTAASAAAAFATSAATAGTAAAAPTGPTSSSSAVGLGPLSSSSAVAYTLAPASTASATAGGVGGTGPTSSATAATAYDTSSSSVLGLVASSLERTAVPVPQAVQAVQPGQGDSAAQGSVAVSLSQVGSALLHAQRQDQGPGQGSAQSWATAVGGGPGFDPRSSGLVGKGPGSSSGQADVRGVSSGLGSGTAFGTPAGVTAASSSSSSGAVAATMVAEVGEALLAQTGEMKPGLKSKPGSESKPASGKPVSQDPADQVSGGCCLRFYVLAWAHKPCMTAAHGRYACPLAFRTASAACALLAIACMHAQSRCS